MITKTIKYTDFAGNEVEREFAFNLSAAEVTELAMTRKGIDQYLREIIKTEDVSELWPLFKELLGKSVGTLLNDRVFDKNPMLTAEFMNSGAYEEFFFELIGDAGFAARFIKGMLPENLQDRLDNLMRENAKPELTDEQLMKVSWEEFYEAAGGKDDKKWDPRFLHLAYRRKIAA